MAINQIIIDKVKSKTKGDRIMEKTIISLLEGVEESKQLKRILDNIMRSI